MAWMMTRTSEVRTAITSSGTPSSSRPMNMIRGSLRGLSVGAGSAMVVMALSTMYLLRARLTRCRVADRVHRRSGLTLSDRLASVELTLLVVPDTTSATSNSHTHQNNH